MRITCIGGGPAHELTLIEGNRAGDTVDRGVVFSDPTVGALRRADPHSAAPCKTPRAIGLRDALARTETGKPQRFGLRRQAGQGLRP